MLIEGKDIIIVGIRTTFARKYLLPSPRQHRAAPCTARRRGGRYLAALPPLYASAEARTPGPDCAQHLPRSRPVAAGNASGCKNKHV